MGHALCVCSRGTVIIDNKRYLFIQKLGEGESCVTSSRTGKMPNEKQTCIASSITPTSFTLWLIV